MASKDKKSSFSHRDSGKEELAKRFRQNPFIFIGTFVVLVLVIVSFVLVPAIVPQGVELSISASTFGYWDGKPIAYTSGSLFYNFQKQYEDDSQARRARMQIQYQTEGQSKSALWNENFDVWSNAFNAAVMRTAVLDIMKKSGYQPPKELIDKMVASLPLFQVNGRFSSPKFEDLKRTDPIRILTMWQDVRDNYVAQRFYEDAGSLLVSSQEADFIGSMAKTERTLKIATMTYSAFPDSALISFVEKNPANYKELQLSQITIKSSEKDAKNLLADIKNKKTTFEAAARSQSEDNFKDKGGDAGVRYVFEFAGVVTNDEDRASLANLTEGSFSDVYKSPEGWVFFSALKDAKNPDLSNSASLEKVRSYFNFAERGTIEDWLLDKANELVRLSKKVSFDEAANTMEFSVGEVGPISINYGNSSLFTVLDSSKIPSFSNAITRDKNFWKTAFLTKIQSPSEPIVLSGGGSDCVAVIYPTEEIIQDDSDLEAIKSNFSTYWENQTINQEIQNSILTSKKFENNFFNAYTRPPFPGAELNQNGLEL
ncbi:MAG: peptidylprolyl isomerase [Spirochaetaceae bacterium]|nr:peptidylprolyl isomerase [Spirochaetaceae bacterium]